MQGSGLEKWKIYTVSIYTGERRLSENLVYCLFMTVEVYCLQKSYFSEQSFVCERK